ncbi:hypothetical protein BD289DRAFT_362745 [Coniella lustricola]|uniref:Uncharacterized protein n=1 Tax=Coniella lustricola TaxID=2025994 RepID=A0A2T3AGH8_9PEZI|nr:hypothetical protein BD289DRAFT_362745 [Coniella lustricola]
MFTIVKLVGGGVGLASEAIHDYRARSRSQSGRSPSPHPDYSGPAAAASSASAASPTFSATTPTSASAQSARQYLGAPHAAAPPEYAESNEDDDDCASSSDGESEIEHDEAAWELDDMAERVAPPSYAESLAATATEQSGQATIKKEEQMIRDIVRMAGAPPQPIGRIPCPVIIPQRRPRNKDRGFVHAYAPVLADCGVGQDVFVRFLQDWLQASKSDPWIDVVFMAAGIVGFVPEVASQIVATVVQVVAGTAKELQSRSRRNTFLDRVNQELFMPRGLYAMVMAFKDELPGQQPRGPLSRLAGTLGKTLFTTQRLDINQTVAKYSDPDPDMSQLKKGLKNIRLVSGKTYTALELPEAAALIYPDLDRLGKGKDADRGGVKDKLKGAGTWVQDYLDRKAQAAYERDHQGSALAVPSDSRKGFSSRFSDPNHAVNSGSFISLVTGGAVDTSGRRRERRAAKQERKEMRREYKDARRVARGKAPRGPRRPRRPRGQRKGIVRKLLQQDVLYLLIVNLPSEQEVQQSVATLENMMMTTTTTA